MKRPLEMQENMENDPLNSAMLDVESAAPHPRRLLPCQSPTTRHGDPAAGGWS
jgi:hypothetical protein